MPPESDALDCWDAYTDSEEEQPAPKVEVDVTQLSQKLQAQKLSECADREFVDDLFSISEKGASGAGDSADENVFGKIAAKAAAPPDPFSQFSLKCLKDCDDVAKKLSQKIEQSPAKSAVWLQFLDTLLQACEKKIDLKDLQTLKRKVEAAIQNKEAKQSQVTFSKKKPNDISSSKNYQDELDMLYGELSDDDEPFYYQ
ncbi:translation initiation factor eIF3 subunit [Babesia caballi]|uniref:Translation initiation factor eIF3 subunit n=1 Tax=Babesia caballi TaxID=5871 RepID=A0AAV4LW79_BABCB|nr:translation initiation factor eIF3 subunit [Babesia caballi]